MGDPNQEGNETQRDESEDRGPDNFFIDILTGSKESVSPKKLQVQKVLKQLIEGYGFNRHDIEVDYRHRIKAASPPKSILPFSIPVPTTPTIPCSGSLSARPKKSVKISALWSRPKPKPTCAFLKNYWN